MSQFSTFWNFSWNQMENERYWSKNKFLLFENVLKLPLYAHLHSKLAKSDIITQKSRLRIKNQGFGSGSGSTWIRINLSCWIRIRIRIQIADPDPDPGGQK